MQKSDVVIIGGGIVGLATAYQITQRFPATSILILEKESGVGQHQTGHNSGVLHSGIYYKPGTLRATNCRAGKLAMENFCREHGIPFDICGKVIVAVTEAELPALDLQAGYVLRALDVLPKSGTRRPWLVSHDFLRDVLDHRLRPLDEQMVFGSVNVQEAQPA